MILFLFMIRILFLWVQLFVELLLFSLAISICTCNSDCAILFLFMIPFILVGGLIFTFLHFAIKFLLVVLFMLISSICGFVSARSFCLLLLFSMFSNFYITFVLSLSYCLGRMITSNEEKICICFKGKYFPAWKFQFKMNDKGKGLWITWMDFLQ